mgnify:CR=1 FL=1
MLQDALMYSYIPAKDVARARAFYEEKLGFRPSREIGGGVTYVCAGGTACFLYPTPNAGTSAASQAFWEGADIEREVAGLRFLGLAFEGYGMPGRAADAPVYTAGGAKAAWFKDSEGNIMALIQTL